SRAVFSAKPDATLASGWKRQHVPVRPGRPPMEFNLADLFEAAVDAFGERDYLLAEGKRRTYAEMDERANRLANHLSAQGVGPGDHVGIYAYNSVEAVEGLWVNFKVRIVCVDIHCRYLPDESTYLNHYDDVEALI